MKIWFKFIFGCLYIKTGNSLNLFFVEVINSPVICWRVGVDGLNGYIVVL
ncbi:hypothetical protein BVRB_2g043760 [Beta vulgaris subsp. vulgaris]|nr:hypothetical protein BVRB_2g043760 [Beta vulgaris subsp. vulgaris]